MSSSTKSINRRALLARLGLAAGAAYVAPSLTTIGMARASTASGASRTSGPSAASGPSSVSDPSRPSGTSRASRVSRASQPSRGARSGDSRPSRVAGRQDAAGDQLPPFLRNLFQR